MRSFAVNALFLVPGQVGGTETYLRRTLREMPALLGADERLVVFANAENAEVLAADLSSAPGVEVRPTGLRAASRVRRLLWENAAFPRAVSSCGAAALWNPGNAALLRAPCPQVTTIHDMQYRRFPRDFSPVALAAMAFVVPAAVRRSAYTLAVSGFSRREVLHFVRGADPERVLVTPEAADPFFAMPPEDPEADSARVRELSGGDGPIVLVVSNSYPHKNLETAVAAYGLLQCEIPHRLVVVGRPRRGEPALQAAIDALPNRCRASRVHYASRADLAALYRAADVLVFPSLYEGFGLPVLEAMSAGLPVVAAREGSVPEVAGEAAVWAPSGDPAGFADAILGVVLGGPDRRAALAAAGRARAAEFSWRRTAALTLDALRRAAEKQ
ncbi:MAG: glycosyltransferase family 4 protein [Kiritimatiellae bacterium]|nr:glycosyltransferase family 4 protein [Kiritimatiellia bacterium]